MKLKKDWSLAYFLHYSCWLGYWLITLNVIVQSIVFINMTMNESTIISDLPVRIHSDFGDDFSSNKLTVKNVEIRKPSFYTGSVTLYLPVEEYKAGIFYYYGVKLYKALILFGVFFFSARFFKNIAEGAYFSDTNPDLLFRIGAIFLLGSLLNLVLYYVPLPILDSLNMPSEFSIEALSIGGDNVFFWAGLMSIVFSYVFKEGARIYQDQKLTV